MYCIQPHLQFIMIFPGFLLAFVHPMHNKRNCGLSFCCTLLIFCWMVFFSFVVFVYALVYFCFRHGASSIFICGNPTNEQMNVLSFCVRVEKKIHTKNKWMQHKMESFKLMKSSRNFESIGLQKSFFFSFP